MIALTRSTVRGLSLIEMLVALVLAGFIMLGVVSVFLSTRAAATAEAALTQVQENGRLAMQLMTQDIRKAHYSGCNSVGGIVELVATGVAWQGIGGFTRDDNGAWSSAAPAAAQLAPGIANGRNGSDLLNVQMATSLGKDLLTADVTSNTDEAGLASNPGCSIAQNDLIIVSSCVSAHLFQVTNSISCTNPASPVTLTFGANANQAIPVAPGYRYGNPSAELMRYESVGWYVADTGRNYLGQDVYALYRSSNGVAEEMLEGVEYLKLEFGQKIGNTGQMRYVSANDASINWNAVTTVRIGVLLQGYDPVRGDDDTEPYNVLSNTIGATGNTAHSGGRVIRKVFSTTATLRNTAYDI